MPFSTVKTKKEKKNSHLDLRTRINREKERGREQDRKLVNERIQLSEWWRKFENVLDEIRYACVPSQPPFSPTTNDNVRVLQPLS